MTLYTDIIEWSRQNPVAAEQLIAGKAAVVSLKNYFGYESVLTKLVYTSVETDVEATLELGGKRLDTGRKS